MTLDESYRTYHRRLAAYLHRSCKSAGVETEDVVQETFIQAWKVWGARTTDNVFAWLLGIGRRVLSHMRRDLHRQKRGGGQVFVEWRAESDQRSEPAVQEMRVLLTQLEQKISTLGPAQQIALRGTMEGKPSLEIAAETGVSGQAVRGSLQLARRRLSQYL